MVARLAGGRLDRAARQLDDEARARRDALLDAARASTRTSRLRPRGGRRRDPRRRTLARRGGPAPRAGARRRARPPRAGRGAAGQARGVRRREGRRSSPRSTTSRRGTAISSSRRTARRRPSSMPTGSPSCATTPPGPRNGGPRRPPPSSGRRGARSRSSTSTCRSSSRRCSSGCVGHFPDWSQTPVSRDEPAGRRADDGCRRPSRAARLSGSLRKPAGQPAVGSTSVRRGSGAWCLPEPRRRMPEPLRRAARIPGPPT